MITKISPEAMSAVLFTITENQEQNTSKITDDMYFCLKNLYAIYLMYFQEMFSYLFDWNQYFLNGKHVKFELNVVFIL